MLMGQLGSRWTYLHEIWYMSISRKSVEKIQVSLKSDKNNGYFKWRLMYIFDHTLLNCSCNKKCFRQNLKRKSKHTYYIQYIFGGGGGSSHFTLRFVNRTVQATCVRNSSFVLPAVSDVCYSCNGFKYAASDVCYSCNGFK
jgi:hypothetical protein